MERKDYLAKLLLIALFGMIFGNFVTNAVLFLNVLNVNV